MINKGISIILPVYNEAGNIKSVAGSILACLPSLAADFEVIIVDDGSTDDTPRVLENISLGDPRVKVVTSGRNLGYGNALMQGAGIARFPLVLFMDADGQFNISEIAKLLPYAAEFGVITGYRQKRKDSIYRIVLGKTYSWLASLLFGLKLKDINCGFKLFKTEALAKEVVSSSAGAFYTEILLRAKNNGYKIKEVPVGHYPRIKGRESGGSPKIIFNAIIDLCKLRFKRQYQAGNNPP